MKPFSTIAFVYLLAAISAAQPCDSIRLHELEMIPSYQMDEAQNAEYRQMMMRCGRSGIGKVSSTPFRFGFDLPLFGVVSLASIPGELQSDYGFAAKNGISFSPGLGLAFLFQDIIMARFGYQFWIKKWKLSYPASVNGNDLNFTEDGRFIYHGLFAEITKEYEHGFVGGGFELSVNNTYKFDARISDTSGEVKLSDLEDNQMNSQFDILLVAGLVFTIANKVRIKPGLKLGIPFIPLFDSGVYKFNIFTLRFGLSVQYFLTPRA
jgi:hypothetical protein